MSVPIIFIIIAAFFVIAVLVSSLSKPSNGANRDTSSESSMHSDMLHGNTAEDIHRQHHRHDAQEHHDHHDHGGHHSHGTDSSSGSDSGSGSSDSGGSSSD
ncbi:hypothetical protein M3194_12935 [Paenibacillus glycanilyticus]|uniref:hypothetical protein n=1 Tax=Paenibacillus glycanilyticus TaxID=126569 RepID=UPI00203BD259|nr:hypothetical protein [Paenibacillus glycanilyticus]MCM3628270.1 hypothetical protein [Paenibacillus glycanilyticus]